MAVAVVDSYSCASGGEINAGRFALRPILAGIGHSMMAQSTVGLGWPWVGMQGKSPHKWINTLLRMPFDYARCDIDLGRVANNMENGFYGESGQTSSGVNTYTQLVIDALAPIVGSRQVVVGIMACLNDLTGGVAPSTIWSNYNSIMNKLDAVGWKTLLSTSPPTGAYNTDTERDAVIALSALMTGALPDSRIVDVLDFTSPYVDTGQPSGYQQPLDGYTTDGTHLTQSGAFKIAIDTYAALDGLYPPWSPTGNEVVCSQNPTLSTTGGTLGSNASGVVPAGFTLQAPGTGCSVVGSQAGDYYQMVFSYSGAAWTATTIGGLLAASFTANATLGVDYIQSLCDVEIVECTNYMFQSLSELDGSHYGECPTINQYSSSTWMEALEGKRMVFHTEPHLFPATANRSVTSFGARPVVGATSASLTVRIRWMGTKRHD